MLSAYVDLDGGIRIVAEGKHALLSVNVLAIFYLGRKLELGLTNVFCVSIVEEARILILEL